MNPEDTLAVMPQLTNLDVAYVRSVFRPQSEDERTRAAAGLAPRPSYVLPDGTPMVSATPDPDLAQAADLQDLHQRFISRWATAGGHERDADPELAAWLNGGYGGSGPRSRWWCI